MTEMEFRKRDIVRSINTNYTVVDADLLLVDASSGAITITLPPPTLVARVLVKKVDSSVNAVTIVTPGSETIDDAASLALATQYEAYSLISDGTNWFVSVIPFVSHAEGASNFAGPGGVTITHNFNLSEYIPDVIAVADAGAIGAIWITDIAVNSFIVRNSGGGVSAFTWSIHKR